MPFVITLLVMVAVLLLCFKKWKWALGIAVVALVLNCWSETFALNVFNLFSSDGRDDGELRVMTFNIHASEHDYGERYDRIARLIADSRSDVVLLNEMNTYYDDNDDKFDSLMSLQYRYSTVKRFKQKDIVFYSKHPICGIDSIALDDSRIFPVAYIKVDSKTFTFVGCHLSSNNYIDSQTRFDADSVRNEEGARVYWHTIKKGYAQRRTETDSIYQWLNGKENVIVLGDFNDIGGSYALRHIESLGFSDAFWNGGFGLGGTRKVMGFPFRIDHILYSKGLKVKNVEVIDETLSDHKPLVATFEVR